MNNKELTDDFKFIYELKIKSVMLNGMYVFGFNSNNLNSAMEEHFEVE